MKALSRLKRAWSLLRPSELGLRAGRCPLCGFGVQLRLAREETSVRCLRCGASAVSQSLMAVVRGELNGALQETDAYELSSGSQFAMALARCCRSLATSEYIDGARPGEMVNGIRHEDVQRLTFADASFDLCTSTEVFEHVEDDMAGFREMLRVLRPGGFLAFTVPLSLGQPTVERTEVVDGQRQQCLPPEYHADRFRGRTVFCYRNYGSDILHRLAAAGFADARIVVPRLDLFGFARPVVTARKPEVASTHA